MSKENHTSTTVLSLFTYAFVLISIAIIIFALYSDQWANASQDRIKGGVDVHNENYGLKFSYDYDVQKNCAKDHNKHPNSIQYLTYFSCGRISQRNDGQIVREFTLIVKENQSIPISHEGHIFNAWTFNGTVPGPTIRATEGDLIQIKVINRKDSMHAHSLHLHSIHPAKMDGVDNVIAPGNTFTYKFIAQPYGVYPYHCHVEPIADHINRGLYGMMIIDPKEPRPKMTEFAMLMNGYDLNYEDEGPVHIPPIKSLYSSKQESERVERSNEIYSVNGVAYDYMINPIKLKVGQPYRIYLVNMLEFDLVNSLHLHGTMFDYFPAGTSKTPEYKTDIVTLGQGDRGILEFKYKYPGKYMFHAHVTEFTDLGWMGFFDVK